jgi:putative membrane protein
MRDEQNTTGDESRMGVPGLIMIGWILGLMWLLGHGRYQAFLRADLWPLLLAAICGFLFFLIALSTNQLQGCGCDHSVKPKRLTRWIQAGFLLLPLWYAFAGASSYTLGAKAFAQRWVHMDADVLTGDDPARTDSSAQSADDTPAKTVSLLDIALSDDGLIGQRVATIGQVYRGPEIPEGHFVVFRFVITCCAADAQPVGVLVAVTGQPLPEVDSWIRVEGKLDLIVHGEQQQYLIRPTSINNITSPRKTYLEVAW